MYVRVYRKFTYAVIFIMTISLQNESGSTLLAWFTLLVLQNYRERSSEVSGTIGKAALKCRSGAIRRLVFR